MLSYWTRLRWESHKPSKGVKLKTHVVRELPKLQENWRRRATARHSCLCDFCLYLFYDDQNIGSEIGRSIKHLGHIKRPVPLPGWLVGWLSSVHYNQGKMKFARQQKRGSSFDGASRSVRNLLSSHQTTARPEPTTDRDWLLSVCLSSGRRKQIKSLTRTSH